MPKTVNYLGTAGELYIASELALRGYVVHVPMTDEGGDLFIVRETDGVSARIQVKSSVEGTHKGHPGYPAFAFTFNARMASATTIPPIKSKLLCAILLIKSGSKTWSKTIVVPARTLLKHSPAKAGALTKTIWIFEDPKTGKLLLGGKSGPVLDKYAKRWPWFFPPVAGRSSI